MSTPLKFKVDLLFYKAETPSMSVYLVAIITFCLGVLVTGSYGIIERFRFKKEIKVLEKNVKEKEKELNSLRNLPVTTEVVSPDKASETD
jgi:ATP adenylyltransferase